MAKIPDATILAKLTYEGYDASLAESGTRLTLYESSFFLALPHAVIIGCVQCGNVKSSFITDTNNDLPWVARANLAHALREMPPCACPAPRKRGRPRKAEPAPYADHQDTQADADAADAAAAAAAASPDAC